MLVFTFCSLQLLRAVVFVSHAYSTADGELRIGVEKLQIMKCLRLSECNISLE